GAGCRGGREGGGGKEKMMWTNEQALRQLWPFVADRPPTIVDWLPWSHTFGGNNNFNLVLWNGGSLYIDAGKPAPGAIDVTLANLRDVSPTIYYNVPRGFDMIIPALERDEALRASFFRDLDVICYAGVSLSDASWRRLDAIAVAARGDRVPFVSAWGSTETAPMATLVHYPLERAGV